MSTAIAKNLQVGSDPTATNNFTIFQPATPDGTLRIGNGNTGITSSLLTINSSGAITQTAATANGVMYANGSKVLTTGSALTFDGSNLGINTSDQTSVLTTRISGSARGAVAASAGFASFAVYDTDNSTYVGHISQANTEMYVWNTANGPLRFGVNDTEQMRLTSTGLGIGTSSPAQKLDVRGNGFISSSLLIGSTSQPNSGEVRQLIANNAGGSAFLQFQNTTTATGCTIGTSGENFLVFTNTNTIGGGGGAYTERMRLDSSGNLGLGVTPSAWGSGWTAFQVGTGVLHKRSDGNGVSLGWNYYVDGTNARYIATAAATQYRQYLGEHSWFTAPSGTAGNAITFTQAMTLSAAGYLGIGTTSPSNTLHVVDTGDNPVIRISSSSAGRGTWFSQVISGAAITGSLGAFPYAFYTNGFERARVDENGNLLVGTTTTGFTNSRSFTFQGVGDGKVYVNHSTANTNGDGYIGFGYNGGQIGSIAQSGTTAVAYNTSSDYRLKENIAPMTGALAKIAALKPCTYNWKADGSEGEGFIAHELAEVAPQCVTGEKDAVDAKGKPVYQGIDTSFLVATLTAAIQELKAEFDAYKATHP